MVCVSITKYWAIFVLASTVQNVIKKSRVNKKKALKIIGSIKNKASNGLVKLLILRHRNTNLTQMKVK